MTHSLHGIAGKEEWVITSAPNCYVVGIKLPNDHAAAIGHDRIAVNIRVLEPGEGVGISGVYTIGALPGNDCGVEIEPEVRDNGHYSETLLAVLSDEAVGQRMADLINEFVNDIGWDAINASYVKGLEPSGLHKLLEEILGK